ncbi:probable ATP-dependent RNA helicase CG8611 [Lucilia cuprina]|uniref:probable ATP-dependent RNA helicase CG8611 n=1 Tax=Lucilia cuprina TaxID=7375 RepID=UPI001F059886|nr:probable ATP-dependent RNA helicase CG8611 [Lucilia cuprina]
MTIELNLTTAPQPRRSKPEEKVKPLAEKPKKVKGPSSSNGFSFEFGGGTQKVKALVARKRQPVKSGVAEKPEDTCLKVAPKSIAIRKKAVAKPTVENSGTKSVALKQKTDTPKKVTVNKQHSDNESDLDTYLQMAKPTTKPAGSDLMLNICSSPSTMKTQPKQKLSQQERIQQKRNARKGDGALNKRTLSHKEIRTGIKKFSQNPNQKPRASDIFEQKERETREALKKETDGDEKKEEVNEPLELGEVDANARKSNAFRVKRPGDSSVRKIGLFKDQPEKIELGQRLVRPIREKLFDGGKLDSIGLHDHTVKNLSDLLGITQLTTVQQKCVPKALEGKDLLVRSQTGSGKTLAYALPIVEKLQEIRPKITRDVGILAIVIVPTRELAIQTYELFQKLVKPFTWIVPGVLMGGERRKAEKARLRKGINILVGTPGRLVDHLLHTETFKVNKAKFLVLDEADRMLEMGYERDVKQIVEGIDKQRTESAKEEMAAAQPIQRLLLSATLTAAVQKLAGLTLNEPIFIDNSDEDPSKAITTVNGYDKESIEAATAELLDGEDSTGILTIPENLKLSYMVVTPKLRLVTLAGLLAREFRGKDKFKALIFMSTMEMVNFHHDLLNEQLTRRVLDEDDEELAQEMSEDEGEEPLLKGLRFFRLHGSMSQTERQGVFKGYRECKSGVLLATDVAGRGIDVPEIDLVIQYSPPQNTADFVHRAGRSARAGRSGRAVLFLTPSEVQFVRYLENKRIRISQVDMEDYLKALDEVDNESHSLQEAASNLQHKFEELIADDKEMHGKACKAFVSWTKFYTTFPKELKPIFNVKNAHMGHFAKSFGLKDQPTSFTKKHSMPKPAPPTNRLTYTERDPEKIKQEKKARKHRFGTTVNDGGVRTSNRPAPNRLAKMIPTSRSLTISEFDSGLPAAKKRKH